MYNRKLQLKFKISIIFDLSLYKSEPFREKMKESLSLRIHTREASKSYMNDYTKQKLKRKHIR